MKIVITPMTLDDLEAIKPDFPEKFDEFWSIDILKSDLLTDNSLYFTAKINKEIVGFAGIKIICDEADIMNIVTQKSYRHLGIGSFLLEKLLEVAKQNNCSSITLEVNEHNTIAIHLYEKYHFKRIGLRKKYYNNIDTAILMKKILDN